MQSLPVGIQSFKMIRNENLVYVDKTKHIYDLVSGRRGFYFFLSRPRRFGKSLLISTLKQLFLGNKDLFKSLWIAQSDYNWQPQHVILLDFSSIASVSKNKFYESFTSELNHIGQQFDIDVSTEHSPSDKLKILVKKLDHVVILIDEYDKPLLQHINNIEEMTAIQAIIRDFYATIKSLGDHVPFLFMTGVTKFSKTSVFSGMNNLIDLTLLPEAADLLGYTETEIDHYFQPYIQNISQEQGLTVVEIRNTMRDWYNGYQFSRIPITVYNPFSVLTYLRNKELRNYWFESGTPSFFVNLIKEKQYSIENLDHTEINISELEAFEVDDLQLIPLLLQTGYLTIREYNPVTRNIRLAYPNEETRAAFLQYFIKIITKTSVSILSNTLSKLIPSLETGNLEDFFTTLKVFFAAMPYTMQLPQEKHYQSIFYVIMSLLGAYVHAEVTTNDGRIDCTIETDLYIYIFEFKLYGAATSALEQIEEKKYYQKFLHANKAIMLVGAAFDTERRNIVDWISRKVNS